MQGRGIVPTSPVSRSKCDCQYSKYSVGELECSTSQPKNIHDNILSGSGLQEMYYSTVAKRIDFSNKKTYI